MISLPNKKENFPQQNKNRSALRTLLALGYPLDRIRHALIILNGRKITDINTPGVGKTVIYNAVKGKTHHYPAMRAIAKTLGLQVEELFDEDLEACAPKGLDRAGPLPDRQAGAQAAQDVVSEPHSVIPAEAGIHAER